MSDSSTGPRERIAVEAAAWFERLRDRSATEEDRQRFARWLVESPVHVREYLGIVEAWGTLQAAAPWPSETTDDLLATVRASAPRDVVALELPNGQRSQAFADDMADAPATAGGTWRSTSAAADRTTGQSRAAPGKSVRTLRTPVLAAAAVVTSAIIAVSWLAFPRNSNEYSTTRGEQRSVVLDDGSVVQLNTLTKLVVHFDGEHRRIDLPRGEAYFRVAHDPTRPFDVETPFARVRAIGTEFNVYNRPEGTRVAVVEGRVQVAATQKPQDAPVALAASESVDVGASVDEKIAIRPVASEPARKSATAWIQRRIVLDDTPLDAAVAEFNRYNKLQMRVEGADLGQLRITGMFSADDPIAMTKYLSRFQNVDVRQDGDAVILRRQR